MDIMNPEKKVMNPESAVEWRASMRFANKKVVLTNGCFDLLHRGHAEYLLAARSQGDALIILLNSDISVRQLKGPSRPVNTEADRSYLLACFSFVDAVMVFDDLRCTRQIELLRPDIYVKGGDYTVETLDPEERGALQNIGAEIRFIPFVAGLSSSILIAKASGKASC